VDSLLNKKRPPVFCPGCAHDRVLTALDRAFGELGLPAEQVVMVSDIGCSGLFDTFFNTHAFHGLHGRALTYATGIKMARPELTVVVTMGDGGLGIGGAHVLSTCRRNIDLTLLVLNNFNYGMTGGQCSATTPESARVGSGFLNRLEKPLDICQVAGAAGAGHVERASTYQADLADRLAAAIRFDGFSLLDVWGICPGRYTKRNPLTPKAIDAALAGMPSLDAYNAANARPEYGRQYRAEAGKLQPAQDSGLPPALEARLTPPQSGRREIVFLGSAGQRIVTAGELLCLAGTSAGLHATLKNDYPITVLRGHSVSEIILNDEPIGYTGSKDPALVVALAQEGVARRQARLAQLDDRTLVIKARGVELPATRARVREVDFKQLKIKSPDWALAALALVAKTRRAITLEMLNAAICMRFKDKVRDQAVALVERVAKEIDLQ